MRENRKPTRHERGGPLNRFRALKMPSPNRLAREAKHAGALMLAVALAATLAAVGLAGAEGARADAAQSAELRIGPENNYGGYHTTWMWADGEMAYCANPSAKTPEGGSYSKHVLSAPSGRTTETAADLWFGYGSPGFDASLWPSEWYDGTPMTNARYAALAHILLSDTYTSDSSYALFGCNADFKRWCRYHVFGFDAEGNLSNENATGRLIAVRAGEVPDNFHPFELHTGAATQLILSFSYIPNGHIDLVKMSANPQVSDGNALYSCEGAVYGVYADGACSKKVAEIRTDANGYGRAEDLAVGDYWVKETKRPSGMAVDPTVYPVEVKSNETVRVNGGFVSDVPQSAAVGLVLAKKDATAGSGAPQGNALLSDGKFKVSYYDGFYSTPEEARASGSPLRAWTVKTDDSGEARLDAAHLVAGDEFFYQADGKTVCLPLGTVLIEELEAPQGYRCDAEPRVVQITSDNVESEDARTYNAPEMPDTVKRGDYRLFKEVPTTSDDEDQAFTRIAVEGIRFEVVNESERPVVSPDTLEEVAPGGVVTTLVTDENGFATTRDHVPEGWTAALAYGEYRLHEVIPAEVAERVKRNHGVTLVAVDDWHVAITEEGQYDPVQVVANRIPQTPLVIQKVDADTGLAIPLACSFQIFDEEGELVTYEDRMGECVLDTWTTVRDGRVTLPMKLGEGTYTLREVAAPEGYVLGEDAVEFTVDECRTWDDPITVVYADDAIRGKIVISKTDAETGNAVAGAEYCVKAASDIATGDGTVRFKAGEIVGYVTTGTDGTAEVDGLYLGAYTVYETKSPEGWALDCAERTVCIESGGQTVPIVRCDHEVADAPTALHILKAGESEEDGALAGAVFRIWEIDAEGKAVKGGLDEELTTGEDGTVTLPSLSHGLFMVDEVAAPEGYFKAEGAEPVKVLVNDQGLIGRAEAGAAYSDLLELRFVNTPTRVDISKVELTTGAELPGASLVVKDADGNVVDEWVSDAEPHRVRGLVPGASYTLEETVAPDGYAVAAAIEFAVEPTGEVQPITMVDELLPTEPDVPDEPQGPAKPQKLGSLAQTGDGSPLAVAAVLAVLAAAVSILARIACRRNPAVPEDVSEPGAIDE